MLYVWCGAQKHTSGTPLKTCRWEHAAPRRAARESTRQQSELAGRTKQPPHCPGTHGTGALRECPGATALPLVAALDTASQGQAGSGPTTPTGPRSWGHTRVCPLYTADRHQTVLDRAALRRFESRKGWWRSLATPSPACLAHLVEGRGSQWDSLVTPRNSLCLSSSCKVTRLLQASWPVDSPSF